MSTYVGSGRYGHDGDGGDRRAARLVLPAGLAWSADGGLIYLDMGRDEGGRLRRIDTRSGVIETLAGAGTREPQGVPAATAKLGKSPIAMTTDSKGNVYIGYQDIGRVDRIDAATGVIAPFVGGGDSLEDGTPAAQFALGGACGLRVDAADNLYIGDHVLHAMFRVDARSGRVTRIAGSPGQAGHAGDGGPARDALLSWPSDIAWDAAGNAYIADRDNHVIRVIERDSGTIRHYAGMPGSPGFDGDGGDRSRARFRYPQALRFVGGAMYVADRMNHRVRRIDLATGTVTTHAGSGRTAYAGENVPALDAGLFEPYALLPTAAGELLVAAARSRRVFLVGDPVALPVPWWRSGWAIAAYLATFALLALGTVRLRTRALRARTAALEASVAGRRRELAEQKALIERQSGELARMIESKDRLMARISHEFRTPLAVILGPTRRQLRDAPAGEYRDYLAAVERHASRLLRLVEQLLGFAKLSHEHAGPTGPVAVAPLLRRMTGSFESRAAERGVALVIGPVDELVVQSSIAVLEAVVGNLVSNAVKFSGAGGQVRVTLGRRDGAAELVVEDQGAGIEADRIATLFEPLHSGEDAQASGVGLALVRQLVDAQGGSIEVASERGRGSRFTVRLPLATTVGAAVAPADGAVSAAAGGPTSLPREPADATAASTVLVIEDNGDMREYLRQLLGSRYRCLLAPDGEQGLALAREEVPDLVLSDVMLPGRDGFEVCRELKADERTSHVPVLLLTALEGHAHRLHGLGEGADDFLAKPFDETELLARVAGLLEIRALLRERYSRELQQGTAPPDDLGARDRDFLKRLARIALAHHADPGFDAPALAAALAMSDRHVQRKLRALLGQTPAEYLRGVRLEQARRRLEAGERPSDVAIAVGFGSHAYFATCFKAQFGHPPGEACGRCTAAVAADETATV